MFSLRRENIDSNISKEKGEAKEKKNYKKTRE